MPAKERALLFKIQEQIKKSQEQPPSTFAPSTGESEKPIEYQVSAYPVYRPPKSEKQG